MLNVKIVSDLDVFNQRIVRMEIRGDYDIKRNSLLRSMGFTYDRYIKAHLRLITDKADAQRLIKHLSKNNKDYVFEFVKVIKRKRSKKLNSIINKVKSNKVSTDVNFF